MNHTLVQSKSDRRPRVILIVLFVALWLLMAVTWMYDEAGYTAGMPGPVFFLMLISPLVAGLVAGWNRVEVRSGAKVGMIAGALFGAANIAGNLIWGGILFLLGRIPPDQPFTFWEGVFEAFIFLLFFAVIGLVLGAIGGALGAAISARRHSENKESRLV